MELKSISGEEIIMYHLLLIAPYGIEIGAKRNGGQGAKLLIAPYGIEMRQKRSPTKTGSHF